MLNAALNPIAAVVGANSRQVAADSSLRDFCIAILHEVVSVASTQGVALELDLSIVDPARMPAHKPSMLQDMEGGRPLETDSILVALQTLARQAGIPTPALDLITAMVQVKVNVLQSAKAGTT
jgi:2-dehydropantoate 2-reductase